ncbi:uncharacterized protein LOC129579744 [Sitodiplosis mosellana]|uniref:uncharacterized protein LOC129579744 n=1 Tax=Sitodiplosis mosellana TaxID=263140 RepID=UPI002444CC0E|nr:uncharacterized protein LOC129579744 [Sitodiplosis mosellana]
MYITKYDEENKLWSGRGDKPLYNPEISLAQVLFSAMELHAPKIAQISDNNGIEMTFDEIRLKTIRAAQNLQELGYQPKQVFAFMIRNSHHVAPTVFGAISIGCSVNSLDPSFGKTELLHMLGTTKPDLMFCDVESYELVKECLVQLQNDAKIFTFGGSDGESEPVENLFAETGTESSFMPVEVDAVNDTALIVCSSGTTGLSKGVCLSHAAVIDGMVKLGTTISSDVMLCFSSLYWITGFVTLLKGTMSGATRIITTEIHSPELQLALYEKYKVTWALCAPYHIILMMKSEKFAETDLSNLRVQTVAGSKFPLHVKNEINSHLPNGSAGSFYGMSETCGVICGENPHSSGSDGVGQLLSGVKMKIVDDQGNRCGPNVDGEICLQQNFKFLGYYGNKQATDELYDDEGFIMSGDIGHFDDDGNLYIIDRKKDLMKYRGFQISPSEMDAFLIESPDIKSSCVVGIPDELGPDLPAAVIVRADGSNISGEEVYDMVAEHFADYYHLRGGVYFVDSLPTTLSGKVLRRKAKEMAIELFKEHSG